MDRGSRPRPAVCEADARAIAELHARRRPHARCRHWRRDRGVRPVRRRPASAVAVSRRGSPGAALRGECPRRLFPRLGPAAHLRRVDGRQRGARVRRRCCRLQRRPQLAGTAAAHHGPPGDGVLLRRAAERAGARTRVHRRRGSARRRACRHHQPRLLAAPLWRRCRGHRTATAPRRPPARHRRRHGPRVPVPRELRQRVGAGGVHVDRAGARRAISHRRRADEGRRRSRARRREPRRHQRAARRGCIPNDERWRTLRSVAWPLAEQLSGAARRPFAVLMAAIARRAADRVREPGEPAACPGRVEAPGVCRARRARRVAGEGRAAAVDREPGAGGDGARAGRSARALGVCVSRATGAARHGPLREAGARSDGRSPRQP